MARNTIIPSSTEAFTGIVLAAENAKRHLLAADHLAAAGEYGLGLSHLILASEEAVKCAIYGFITTRFPFPTNFVEKFLRQHGVRHKIAEQLGVLEHGIHEFLKRVEELEAANPSKDPRSNRAFVKAMMELPSQLEQRIKDDPAADLFPKVASWWRDANRQKNRGFYVDFENGRWASPADVDSKEFYDARTFVEMLITILSEAGHDWVQESVPKRRLKVRRYFDMIRILSRKERKKNVDWGS
jgi:AbiV family abortive infection protein